MSPSVSAPRPAWDAPCRLASDGRHAPRVDGYTDRPAGMACQSPLGVECRLCEARTHWSCRSHRSSRCSHCAGIYRRRVSRLVAHGIPDAVGDGRASRWHLGMLTLTAPSFDEHRHFVPGRPGDHGSCRSCRRHAARYRTLGRWNADATGCWNRLRTALSRESDGLTFFRATEVQDGKRGGRKRGALHFHVVVKWTKPVALQRIHALALDAGFGCVLDWRPIDPGSRWAALYVSKYVTKSCDARGDVAWFRVVQAVDEETGEVTDRVRLAATYRTWSCSRSWGLTMAEITAEVRRAVIRMREHRAEVAALVSACADPHAAEEPPPD